MLKRILALVLSAILLIATVAGCGGKTDNSTATSSDSSSVKTTGESSASSAETGVPSEFKKVKFVMYGDMGKRMQEFSQNELKERLKKDLNMEIEWQYLPWGEYGPGKKVDLMIAAGESFDAFLGDKGWMMQLKAKKMILDVTEYGSKYLTDLKKVVAPEAIDSFTVDGSLYSVPVGNKPQSEFFYSTSVRQDMLEDVGMSEIKTIDDLSDFALKVKAKHPDMYAAPIILGYQYIRGLTDKNLTFMWDLGQTFMVDQDNPDKLIYWYESDEYKKLCTYTRKWYDNGLIPVDLLTNTSGDVAMFESGRYLWFRGAALTTEVSTISNLTKNVPTAKVKEYLMNPEKPKYRLFYWGTNYLFPVTAKNADRAMMFINYSQQNTDNLTFLTYGVKDKDYTQEGEKLNLINKEELVPVSMFNINLSRFTTAYSDEFIERYKKWDNGAKPVKELKFTLNVEPFSTELSKVNAVIKEKLDPITYGFVKYDDNYESALKDLKAAGLDKVKEEVQKQWDAFLAANK
jgi:putative aldouronate transport system substrate-binding protein